MNEIVLTEEQAQILANSGNPVKVVDSRGNLLGFFSRNWTEADLREADRRFASTKKWHTTDEVLARLASLENQ